VNIAQRIGREHWFLEQFVAYSRRERLTARQLESLVWQAKAAGWVDRRVGVEGLWLRA
jgi:hypothetical protein